MKALFQTFSKPGDPLLDTFARPLPTVIVCQVLDKSISFLGFEKLSGCTYCQMAGLVEVYSCWLENNISDFKNGEKWMGASRLYLNGVKTRKMNKWLDS